MWTKVEWRINSLKERLWNLCTYFVFDIHYVSEADEKISHTFIRCRRIIWNMKFSLSVLVKEILKLLTLTILTIIMLGDNSAQFIAEIMSLHYADLCCVSISVAYWCIQFLRKYYIDLQILLVRRNQYHWIWKIETLLWR